jgi:hypothetical protein
MKTKTIERLWVVWTATWIMGVYLASTAVAIWVLRGLVRLFLLDR